MAEAYLAGLEARAAQGLHLNGRLGGQLLPEPHRRAAGPPTGEAGPGRRASGRGREPLSWARSPSPAPRWPTPSIRKSSAANGFKNLAAQGARTQRLLWASTSTKNPAYPDVKYVEPLIGPETVNTLPLETLEAYRDHGNPAARLAEDLEKAAAVLQRLPELGLDLNQATQQLEDEGVEKFNQPYDSLMCTLEGKRREALESKRGRKQ